MPKSCRQFTFTFVIAFILAFGGCGGGGSGSATGSGSAVPTPAPVTPTIVDSFGRTVVADGADGTDGVGVGDAGADGTAGDGAPIVGGRIQITDMNGKSVTATTDNDGYYRAKVTNFTPPFVVKVTKTDGQVRYSLNVTPLKTNGFVTINISGLTQKIASDLAVAAGKSGAAQLTPQIVADKSSAIAASIASLQTQLNEVIIAGGIDPNTFKPLTVPFKADHTGYDFVLDQTTIFVDSSGATHVFVSPSFVRIGPAPALAGNWQATLHSVTSPPTADTVWIAPASDVPTSAAAKAALVSVAPSSTLVQPSGYTQTFSYTRTGTHSWRTTITMVGSRNEVWTDDRTILSYSGCGICGVGSQISYVENIHTIANGVVLPDFISVYTFVRMN